MTGGSGVAVGSEVGTEVGVDMGASVGTRVGVRVGSGVGTGVAVESVTATVDVATGSGVVVAVTGVTVARVRVGETVGSATRVAIGPVGPAGPVTPGSDVETAVGNFVAANVAVACGTATVTSADSAAGAISPPAHETATAKAQATSPGASRLRALTFHLRVNMAAGPVPPGSTQDEAFTGQDGACMPQVACGAGPSAICAHRPRDERSSSSSHPFRHLSHVWCRKSPSLKSGIIPPGPQGDEKTQKSYFN